ncbi:MAG: DUF421 domain-containing protein [Actinomycetota bacterium]|nr:DUF421 domain-containing protein [Actinomycetota bacterium]
MSPQDWFGTAWSTLGWSVMSAIVVYLVAVAVLRIAERRTFAGLTPFDYVAAVVVGSIVARVATTPTPRIGEGAAAIVVIVALHRALGRLRRSSDRTRWLLSRPPLVLVEDGAILPGALGEADLTTAELASVMRTQGVRAVADVDLAVIEPDGSISVLTSSDRPIEPMLREGLRRPDR